MASSMPSLRRSQWDHCRRKEKWTRAMSRSETAPSVEAIRFKDVYGIFVLSPDDVQFRTGSLSGTACVVSDPERRGLLGPIIERLFSLGSAQRRPWNEAEIEILDEIIPQLQESGIIEADGQHQL